MPQGLLVLKSSIEITGGVGKLKNIETATNFTEDFNDSSGLTFSDNNKIEIVGGANAALKLIDNTSQTFNQPFDSDSGFTYDSNKTEFTGGKIQQKDAVLTNSTCWATYTTNVNLNYSTNSGTLTGTAVGGASVVSNRLDLAQSDLRYVDYQGVNNVDSLIQTGCLKANS